MYTILFSVFVGLIALAVALPLRKRSLKSSEIRTRKALKKEMPDANEDEINMIMDGGANVGDGKPDVMNLSNSRDLKM